MPVDTLSKQKNSISEHHGAPEGGLELATIEASTVTAEVTTPILSA